MKAYPTDERGQLDAGAARDEREAPRCCARVTDDDGRTGWCQLRDGHAIRAHVARLSRPLPTNAYEKGKRHGRI